MGKTRAHSFTQNFFCQIPLASLQNSVDYRGKIVQILRLTAAFHLWVNCALSYSKTLVSEGLINIVTLCWVMLAMYKENYPSIFHFKYVTLHCIYLQLLYHDSYISMDHSFGQFSLIFSVIKICHQVKNHTNWRWIFNLCKILQKYQNSATQLKIPRPTENCEP